MKIVFTFVIILFSLSAFTQSKKEIVEHGIEVKRYYEKELEEGDADFYLFKEEFYNKQGEIIELKEYSKKGKDIKSWFKYKFDDQSQLIEELELDAKGNRIERIEYKYEKGLRTQKLYYDSKNRLRQIRKYEYDLKK